MKKSLILILLSLLSLSVYSIEKKVINKFDQSLIKNLFNVDSQQSIITKYFNMIERFSLNYYKVNPVISEMKYSQFLKLLQVDESVKILNLVYDVDSYIDLELLSEKKRSIYRVHLAKFLSEVMIANVYSFNITQIEIPSEATSLSSEENQILNQSLTDDGKRELVDLFGRLGINQSHLELRLQESDNHFAGGIAIYDDLARASLMINDNESYSQILSSFELYSRNSFEVEGPLSGGFRGGSSYRDSQNSSRDFLAEVARIGYAAPLARLRNLMTPLSNDSFSSLDPMQQDHSLDHLNEFVRDMSLAYGGGDFGPSFGSMRNFDRPVITKDMVETAVNVSERIGSGVSTAATLGKISKGNRVGVTAGFILGFFSSDLKDVVVDKTGNGVENSTRSVSKTPVDNEKTPATSNKKPTKSEKEKEKEKEDPKAPVIDEEDEEENEIKKKKGVTSKVDPRIIEELGRSHYKIDRLAKEKMAIRMSMDVNPGRPSVFAKCADDEGDFLFEHTGSRIRTNFGNTINRRVYDTRDMPLIIFEEERD